MDLWEETPSIENRFGMAIFAGGKIAVLRWLGSAVSKMHLKHENYSTHRSPRDRAG